MKKVVIFLLIFISCSENSKPDNLMSENQMVDFLFDINIINSSRAFRNISDLNYYNIKDTFLYKLHNIDSLQFVNSNKYYSSKPKKYLKGTKMSFAGLKKESDIANVIAYLKLAK